VNGEYEEFIPQEMIDKEQEDLD